MEIIGLFQGAINSMNNDFKGWRISLWSSKNGFI